MGINKAKFCIYIIMGIPPYHLRIFRKTNRGLSKDVSL